MANVEQSSRLIFANLHNILLILLTLIKQIPAGNKI